MISPGMDIFRAGERFRGYTVERLLGKGALGAVYLVRHEMLDTLFALKVLYPQVAAANPSYVKRFLREAKISTRVRHPNLVSVHDCGFDEGKDIYFLVMDYVSGGNLREALAFSGRLTVTEAATIVAQIAGALDAAQRYGIVHRDIKPENIMLKKDGGVKLVDLGIAKATGIKDSVRTTVDSVFGTPAYVAPEQAHSAAEVDARADVYSLGIVFFEMVCGRCPYSGKNAPSILLKVLSDEPVPDVRDFNSEVPHELASLIGRMCAKDRNQRIGSHAEVIAELGKTGVIGELPSVSQAEYSEHDDPMGSVAENLGIDLDDRSMGSDNALTFETQDIEMRKFVSGLKRRRMLKKMFLFSVPVAVLLVVWLVLTW